MICIVCFIKGNPQRGILREEQYVLPEDEGFTLDMALCEEHYNIFKKYVKKFGWKVLN